MTYLWQEERGNIFYKVQTDDKDIANKLKRRNGFKLSAAAINKNVWVFNCRFARPDIARKTLKSISHKNIKIDSEGVISSE